MRADLPSGTVTFLFTDIEGSTRLLQELGDGYADVLAEHHRALREVWSRHGGVEVDTQGDAFFVAFGDARAAVAAASDGQSALVDLGIRVRMGIHTGKPLVAATGYVGLDVHRAARIAAVAHGGQILVSEATERLVADRLVDLGRHRLKDLGAPERLFQVGSAAFAPLRSLYATNLPVQANDLIGRETEVAQIRELIRAGRRLVTLTGPGGVGKTRLAVHAAAELVRDFPDGAWFVALSAVNDPRFVEGAIREALAVDDVRAYLLTRRLLLVLDNLEQIVGAAPVIGELLAHAPGVRALATSRERLALRDEQEYPVLPLPPTEAVALFTDRARRLHREFDPDRHVEAIARRLDGLPLALELAAARTKLLSARQIEERLGSALDVLTTGARDAPERQRTLRATVDWSYDLLDPADRSLFARLAVFAGGFTVEAAESIAGEGLDPLQGLVEKSLLRHGAGDRLFMLETIRAYAAERFAAAPDAHAVRQAHAVYYATLSEREARRLWDDPAAVKLSVLDHDNVRAALAWSRDHNPDLCLRLVAAASDSWLVRGLFVEADEWLEHALTLPAEREPAHYATALAAASSVAHAAGRYEEARRQADDAVALQRRLGDVAGLAHALNRRANALSALGDRRSAEAAYREGLDAAIEAGDTRGEAVALINLGVLAAAEQRKEDVLRYCGRALELFESLGNSSGAAISHLRIGLALLPGPDAKGHLSRALDVYVRRGSPARVATCLVAFAEVARLQCDAAAGARLLEAAAALRTDVGAQPTPVERAEEDSLRAWVHDTLDAEALVRARAEGAAVGLEEAAALARSLE